MNSIIIIIIVIFAIVFIVVNRMKLTIYKIAPLLTEILIFIEQKHINKCTHNFSL